ncbi:hypothetical protein DQ04_00451000 [Trypanosoma grayi]|uniref:hypothetical protein n=1 Tax=Trypanosoma grayi TaxID=71804 RepID=UPI0004F46341|nr:hypothetical protein DQ04_00451000 [Trypanosoma grayi]KEG14461.1 hypothetical protein DQ04_00451000 [Trypanosoma grayi]
MEFRVSLTLTVICMACDLTLLSIRIAFLSGVVAYILLALHEAVLIALAVLLASFILRTCWLLVGPIGDALLLLRVVGPLWLLRVVFTFLPTVYKEVVLPRRHAAPVPRAWADVGYAVVCSLDVAVFAAFSVALLHAVCFLTERTLYTPSVAFQRPPVLPAGVSRRSNPIESHSSDAAGLHAGGASTPMPLPLWLSGACERGRTPFEKHRQ